MDDLLDIVYNEFQSAEGFFEDVIFWIEMDCEDELDVKKLIYYWAQYLYWFQIDEEVNKAFD